MLDPTKSCQNNDMPTKIIREHSDIFTEVLLPYVNNCLNNGIFPPNLKFADVSPIHKKG